MLGTLKLYRSCTRSAGVNPLGGTNYLGTASVFHRKTSRQDRLGTTIANSLDPEHPPFYPSSNASSATRAFISALKLRRCLDFISVPSPKQGFYLLIAGPNCRGHRTCSQKTP